MNRKSQTAIEFLANYGWALLLVVVGFIALYYFGIFDPNRYLPDSAIISNEIMVKDFTMDESFITLIVSNFAGVAINNLQITASDCGGDGFKSFPLNMAEGESRKINIFCRNPYGGPVELKRFRSKLDATYETVVNGVASSHSRTGYIRTIVNPDNNLAYYFPFDTDTNDYSKNKFTATNNGATQTSGKLNGGYYFDGDMDFVLPDSLLEDSNEITIAVWTNPEDKAVDNRRVIFFDGDSAMGLDTGLMYQPFNDITSYAVKPDNDEDVRPFLNYYNYGAVVSGNYLHIASVISSDSITLFLDGVSTKTVEGEYNNNGHHFSAIGAAKDNAGFHCCGYKGAIDELFVWKIALDEEKIKALYAAGAYS